MTPIQTSALHRWDLGIGLYEKDVHVDRDLGVSYMKIFFKIYGEERNDCESKFRPVREQVEIIEPQNRQRKRI